MKLEDEEKRVIILSLISLVLLAGLYFYSLNIQPSRVEISSLQDHVGEYVEVEGIVTYTKNTTKGTIIEVYDLHRIHKAYIFLLFHGNIIPGATVRARGMVQVYQGIVEIVVKNRDDIDILSPSLSIDLPTLLENPQFFVGMRVKVWGNLTGIYEIVDRHQIQITDGINTTWVSVSFEYFGERDVYLTGVVRNGSLEVENITLQSDEKCVSIGDIGNYEGKKICVHAYILSYERLYGYSGWLKYGDYSLRIFMKKRGEGGECYIEGTFVYDEKSGIYELIVE